MGLEPLTEKLQFIPGQIKDVQMLRNNNGDTAAMLFDTTWLDKNVKLRLENIGHAQCITIIVEDIPGQLQVTQLEIYENNPAMLNIRTGIQFGTLAGNSFSSDLFYPTHFLQHMVGGLNISTAYLQNIHTANQTIRFNRISKVGEDNNYIHRYEADPNNTSEENVFAANIIHLLTAQITGNYSSNTPSVKDLIFDVVDCGKLYDAINMLPKK